MTTNEHQLRLHPAADVFRNQLLTEVAEENAQLESNVCRFQAACDFLGGIDLRLGGGRAVSATLRRSFVVNDFNGLPCLCVPVDRAACRLADFGRGRVRMSGQDVGAFPGVGDSILSVSESGQVHLKMLFSARGVVEGMVEGLSNDDFLRVKTGAFGDEQLINFLRTGRGLRNPNDVTFVLETIFMIITDDLRETIRVLGPLPKFENEDQVCCSEPLPVDPSDFVDCPPQCRSNESLLVAITTLGCTDREISLLDENRALSNLNHRLSKIEERIGKVEISNTVEETSFSLEDGIMGEDVAGSPVWQYSLRNLGKSGCMVLANNMHLMEVVVSGIRSDLEIMEIHVVRNENGTTTMYFSGTYENKARIFGVFDPESAPGVDTNDFEDVARGFMSGEQQFPPSFTLVLTSINFPLHTVREALGVLRVEASSC